MKKYFANKNKKIVVEAKNLFAKFRDTLVYKSAIKRKNMSM